MLPRNVSLTIEYNGTAATGSSASEIIETYEEEVTEDIKYTVVSGDTLWGIAVRYYGNGADYTKILWANYDQIEQVAKEHGYKSSDYGHWIWAGEVFTIPGIKTTRKVTNTNTKPAEKTTGDNKLGEKIQNHASAFTYTDPATGESDSVSITVDDIGKEWMGASMPKRGAMLTAKLNLHNDGEEKSLACGKFTLDDISFSGRPLTCTMGGVSTPATDDFTALPRTKTWENVNLKSIAQQIASDAGVTLVYDADTIYISEIEQNNQTDSSFLSSLCSEYGVGMKVYNNKLVLIGLARYEKKEPVATIKEEDMLQWSANTTVQGTYTGVKLTYTDPDDSKNKIDVMVGSEGRLYTINKQAKDEGDARLKAQAALDDANRKILTMDVTVRGRADLVATQNITIEGLGSLDGRYFIEKAKHTVGSGYKTQYTLHRIWAEVEKATSESTATEAKEETSYAKTEWKVGDKVKITGVYVASTSAQKLRPAITEGTINTILAGTRNPYLVYSGSIVIGWVNEEDMSRI